jgi:plasmid stabilization system protein ParE
MSPHELRLILSPKAQEDFTDIHQYTLEIWGEAQQLAYRAILDKALLTVLGNPRIGTEDRRLLRRIGSFRLEVTSSFTG